MHFFFLAEYERCKKCGSGYILKNGSNGSGNPECKGKARGFGGGAPTVLKSEAFKGFVVQAAKNAPRLVVWHWPLNRTFGLSPVPVGRSSRWLRVFAFTAGCPPIGSLGDYAFLIAGVYRITTSLTYGSPISSLSRSRIFSLAMVSSWRSGEESTFTYSTPSRTRTSEM